MDDRRLVAAKVMLEHERFADAERVARDVLASDPNDAEAHRTLAMAYAGQEKLDGALVEMQAAVAAAPDSAYNLYSLAFVYTRRGELSKADRAARDALAREPDDGPTLRLLAHIELAQGRPRSALAAADEALNLEPWRVTSYVARADALFALRRPQEALAMLREALAIEPNDANVQVTLGTVEASLDRHREAEAAFREALRLDPRMELARAGLIVAMKLRNPLYRALRGRYRLAFIIGAAATIGGLAQFPRLYPVAVALLLVVLPAFMFIDQASTLRIRFDRQGRRALSALETTNSNIFAGALAATLVAALAWVLTRTDAIAFAAFSLGFVFLFVNVAIDRKPGRVRSFILGNAIAWASVSIVTALVLGSTGSADWTTEIDRIQKTGGVLEWIADASFFVLLIQLFVFGTFMTGFGYFDLTKRTLGRSYSRVVDLRRSWPFKRRR